MQSTGHSSTLAHVFQMQVVGVDGWGYAQVADRGFALVLLVVVDGLPCGGLQRGHVLLVGFEEDLVSDGGIHHVVAFLLQFSVEVEVVIPGFFGEIVHEVVVGEAPVVAVDFGQLAAVYALAEVFGGDEVHPVVHVPVMVDGQGGFPVFVAVAFHYGVGVPAGRHLVAVDSPLVQCVAVDGGSVGHVEFDMACLVGVVECAGGREQLVEVRLRVIGEEAGHLLDFCVGGEAVLLVFVRESSVRAAASLAGLG